MAQKLFESGYRDWPTSHLKSERGRYGPDVFNPWTRRAWDITTTAQWRRHVLKYIVNPKAARPVYRSLSPLLTK